MKENYVYPATMKKVDEMYQVEFLDFPDASLVEADTKEEVIRSAQECLALTILDYESRNQELPIPTDDATGVVFIHIWMPYFRNAAKEIYVKKLYGFDVITGYCVSVSEIWKTFEKSVKGNG